MRCPIKVQKNARPIPSVPRAYLNQAFTHGAGVGQTQIWTMFHHALRNRSEARSDTGRPFKHVGPHVSAVKLYAIWHHSNINMHVNFIAIVQSFLWSMGLHWPKLGCRLDRRGIAGGDIRLAHVDARTRVQRR